MRLSIVALSFLLSLAACGKNPADKPGPEPTRVSEADTPTEPAKPAAPSDAAPAPAPSDAAPAPTDTKPASADPTPDATAQPTEAAPENPPIAEWMAWEGGVDIVGMTKEGMTQPNVIFHIARMVHTPLGSAASGMILYAPEADKPPVAIGFVSTDAAVGAYFGPKIFAGTPFEGAPVTVAEIEVKYDAAEKKATARCKVGDNVFEAELHDVGPGYLIHRKPGGMTPFYQQGVEAKAGKVLLKVNGAEVPLVLPPVGITGGPPAVFAANGVYAR